MKRLTVELSNGYRYTIEGSYFKYSVMCIHPENKVGPMETRESDYHLEDGTKVYKARTYHTVGGAIGQMEIHAGLVLENVDICMY